MRLSAFVRATAVLASAALTTTLLGVGASHAASAEPVVAPDTITLYPAQSGVIDVLANDTGDDLALCRFPEFDPIYAETIPAVVATHDGSFFGGGDLGTGEVLVMTAPRARGTHVVDYYVCDHSRLVPAELTVVIRPVAPVDVHKIPGRPGRLKVRNHNKVAVQLWYGDPRAVRPDRKVRIKAGASRTVRVRRHRVAWIALIGVGSGKGSLVASPGLADHGVVRHIKLDGKPLPRPKDAEPDDIEDLLGRWRG